MLFKTWLGSSIGKKQTVAVTGLGISLFAFLHVSGNMMMFFSPEMYNIYGHQLVHNPVFPALELLLLAAFLFHIVLAVSLAMENRRARPKDNVSWGTWPKRSSFAARTMIYSGLLLLVFMVLHLQTFKFGHEYTVMTSAGEVRDLYRLLIEKFQNPVYVVWYEISLVVLGIHLSHGIASSFQSLGIMGVRNPKLRLVAWGFAILVAGGFMAQPLWIYFGGV